MVFRKFLERLKNSRKGDTETARLGFRSSSSQTLQRRKSDGKLAVEAFESRSPALQRRKSDGKQSGRSIQSDWFLPLGLGATGGATSEIPSGSGHHPPTPDVDESRPISLSSYIIDPTAAYEKKTDWKSTLYSSAGLVVDVLKESSDAFTPLKSVAGCLSAILKHYDVRYMDFFEPFIPLTFEPASDGEP